MTFDDIKLIEYKSTGARRFGYWVHFRDRRPRHKASGKKGKLSIIKFVEQNIGPLGQRWQYQRYDQTEYILKLDTEHDLLLLLLRFQ